MSDANRPKGGRQPAEPEPSSSSIEQPFGSTSWEWKRVKMRRLPKANGDSAPKGLHTWARLPAWPVRRKPLSITVIYRGGPECWYEVHSRGRSARFTGALQLHDLVRAIAKHE